MKGVINIGAHYGENYNFYAKEGAENFLFIEPVKANFDEMCRRLPEEVKKLQIAVGNQTGKVKMFIETVNEGKSCTILEPSHHLEWYPNIPFPGEEIVEIDKLDNVDYDRTLYDELHIKAQGFELEVLKGATESLKSIKTITIQVYKIELFKGCPLFQEIINYLEEYEVAEIKWRCPSWGVAKFERI